MVGALSTFSVNVWVAVAPMPFVAENVKVDVPVVIGVPLRLAVPLPLSVKTRPCAASVVPLTNVRLRVAAGTPVVLNVNTFGWPCDKVAVAALVIFGGWLTCSVKTWLVDPEVLLAVIWKLYVPPLPAAGVPVMLAVPLP